MMAIQRMLLMLRYVGEYRKDKMHGTGTFTWGNGTIYKGQFEAGKVHGKGVKTYATGETIEGTFIAGQPSITCTRIAAQSGGGGTGKRRKRKKKVRKREEQSKAMPTSAAADLGAHLFPKATDTDATPTTATTTAAVGAPKHQALPTLAGALVAAAVSTAVRQVASRVL